MGAIENAMQAARMQMASGGPAMSPMQRIQQDIRSRFHQHQVQPNETPATIARRYGTTVSALLNANPHKPTAVVAGKHTWHSLRHGEMLNIPVSGAVHGLGAGEQYATVTATKLNMRGFAPDGPIVAGNSKGDILTVVDWNPEADGVTPAGWAKMSSPLGLDANGNPGRTSTIDGYMSKQFLALQPSAPALPPGTPIAMPQIPGLPTLPVPGGYAPSVVIPGLPLPLPPPSPPPPALAAQALAAMLSTSRCAGCGDDSSPLSQATYAFKKATLSDPSCQGMACANIYGSTYNTAAMHAYGPGTQAALSKAIGSSAPPACTDSSGACLGGAQPAPSMPSIPVSPAVFPTPSGGSPSSATVTATKLNIRANPSATSLVVGGVTQGSTVNVLNWNGAPSDSSAPMGWAQVNSPTGLNSDGSPGRTIPVVGYMSKQYLSAAPGKVAPPPPPAQQVAQTCPPGQMYVPILGCVPVPGLPPSVLPAPMPSQPSVPVQPAKLDTTCPPGQMYVPLVGCVPNVLPPLPSPGPSTPIGPAPSLTLVTCPAGQILNPLSGKCVAIPPIPVPEIVLPKQQPAPAPAPGGLTVVPPTATAAKGLSTGAMVGVGLGAAALLGVVAYAATRKKTGHAGKRGKAGHKGKSAHRKGKKK